MLLTPGPVQIPSFVLEALQQQPIHHRSETFEKLYKEVKNGLQYLFQTQQDCFCLGGSGTTGVEMVMSSLLPAGTRVFIPSNGKFSERWVNYGKLINLEVEGLSVEWGKTISTDLVEAFIAEKKEIKAAVLTHCETSTGTEMDLEEVALRLREKYPEILIIVDGISTIGNIPFYMDDWGIDAVIIASQKSLMSPAGLSAVCLSKRSVAALRQTSMDDSNSLYPFWKASTQDSYPFTAPVHLIYAAKACLEYFEEKGLPLVWNEVHQRAMRFRAVLKEFEGKLVAETPSDSLTAFSLPNHETNEVQTKLIKEHDIHLAGGQGPLSGQILRISHMASTTFEMQETCIKALIKLLGS